MTQLQKKAITFKLYGSQKNYQAFKKANEIASIFEISPQYFSYNVEKQVQVDLRNLEKIKKFVNKELINGNCLKFLSLQMFSPAYTILTHLEYFRTYFQKCSNAVKSRYQTQVRNLEFIGGVFDQIISVGGSSNQIQLEPTQNNNYKIKQDPNSYFFSSSTNIFMNCAILPFQTSKGTYKILFLRLRDAKHELLDNVRTKYFGEVISPEYRQIGYNLNNYEISIEDTQLEYPASIVKEVKSVKQLYQFEISLFQLYKAIEITIRYTSMRKQFKTIPNSKEQRRILEYQAVSSRIIDGFCLALELDSIYSRLQLIPTLIPLFSEYYQYIPSLILEKLITLRQCCGGYGFLKLSGHPQLIQRMAYRTSINKKNGKIPQDKAILQNVMLMASQTALRDELLQKSSYERNSHARLIKIFHLTTLNKRLHMKKTDVLHLTENIKHFLQDIGIGLFFFGQRLNTYRAGGFVLKDLLTFSIINGIWRNEAFIDQSQLGENKLVFLNFLAEEKKRLLINIQKQISFFSSIFEIQNFRDIVLGKSDQQNFYNEIYQSVQKNYRNSKQFRAKVQKPIIQFLQANSAKL